MAIAAMVAAPLLLPGANAAVEAQSPTAKPSATSHRTRSHKKPDAAQPAAQVAAQPAPPAPAAPKLPNWPANDPPAPASVVWDSHGLSVAASNSSLAQILKEVSVDTGVKIEGFTSDERIFGTYGPAPASHVLSELLDGSNYDVLMVGDQGQGTPRRVVLTPHSNAAPSNNSAAPAKPSEEDSPVEEQSQQQPEEQPPLPPQAQPNAYAPDVPMRTQQQLIQEMQQRERQLDQQRQQQQNPQ